MRRPVLTLIAAGIAGTALTVTAVALLRPSLPTVVVNGVSVTAPDHRCVREGDESPTQLEWRRTGRLVVILDGTTPRTLPAADALQRALTGQSITGVWTCPP